jgi:hypothetical protein
LAWAQGPDTRGVKTLQKFASVHAAAYTNFNLDRHLNRCGISTVLAEWHQFAA